MVQRQVQALADKNVTGGALVAIRPSTGEILAMVGSPDFNAQPAGQVNMAIRPRQPGSAIKPLTYVAAFENGWTPATLIWDVPSEFPPSNDPYDTNPPYKPVNYDNKFHGPVTVRTALANSYNIPAVKTLQSVGIYDNPDTSRPDGLISMARRLGILDPHPDGLRPLAYPGRRGGDAARADRGLRGDGQRRHKNAHGGDHENTNLQR